MTSAAPTEPDAPALADRNPGLAARRRSGGTTASDAQVAEYAAARGFLAAEWFGATLMVASFTLLYLLAFGAHARPATTYAVCLAFLAVGTAVFLRSRAYYARIGVPLAPRLHGIAAVVAGSAGIFWLLFLVLVALAFAGVSLLPE